MAIMDRVRRGQHDLAGLPADLRRIVEAALDPDPRRRPTLDDVARLAALPGTGRSSRPARPRSTTTPTRTPSRSPWPPRPTSARSRCSTTIPRTFTTRQMRRAGPACWRTSHGPGRSARRSCTGCGACCCSRGPAGRRRRRRGVPLARDAPPARADLGPAQRLAGRQRGRRPPPAARGEVVRPGDLAGRRTLARRPGDPRHRAAGRCGASGWRSPPRCICYAAAVDVDVALCSSPAWSCRLALARPRRLAGALAAARGSVNPLSADLVRWLGGRWRWSWPRPPHSRSWSRLMASTGHLAATPLRSQLDLELPP